MNEPSRKKPANTVWNWRSLIWILIIWIVFAYVYASFSDQPQAQETISYTEFKEQVRQGDVAQVTFEGSQIQGQYKQKAGAVSESKSSGRQAPARGAANTPATQFRTTLPEIQDPELMSLLEGNDVTVFAREQKNSMLLTVLVSFLPWILILGLFFYASRRFQQRMGGAKGGGLLGFGKSKAKLYTRDSANISFADVAGLENAKKELLEVVEFLKNPGHFTSLGGQLPHGLLLVGPPGVGKTLMARAAAGEADVPFYSISGSEFIEMFVGVGASRVRDMFSTAKKEAPAIIFVDELDSIGRVRGTGLGGGNDEREQTLNQILSEMDGFAPQESVIVIAATNRPDVLDPALVRPGRFDRQIHLDLPQRPARLKILKIHTRNVPLAQGIDLQNLAERTVGFSGADLKNLVNEAALLAARKQKQEVAAEDFEQARDKIIMGIEREDILLDDEKKLVAYHESGHALMAELMPEADPLQKVTIIPRGRALGATEQLPEEDRHNLKRSYLLDRIAVMLGGRAAEQLVFNDLSTGAGHDLKSATQLARRMVCHWGMSDKIGPMTFKQGEPHPFLGREITENRDFSEATAQLIDEEIQKILMEMEQRALETLSHHRVKLDALAGALLEHETIDKQVIRRVLDGVVN